MGVILHEYNAVTFNMCMKCGSDDITITPDLVCVNCEPFSLTWRRHSSVVCVAYILGIGRAKNGTD